VDVRTVNEHIKNIFNTGELEENSVIREFRITADDGKKYLTKHYNLDMVISVGYRVNSKTATKFRQWASKTLKEHLTKGFTINKKLIEKNYQEFLQAVEQVKSLSAGKENVGTNDVLELIKSFASTWFSLESYDKEKFPTKGNTKKKIQVEAQELYEGVEKLKKDLINKKLATELFAQEKSQGNLEGILGNVLQSLYGKEVYPSVEEKATHLLYFIIKNHPFTDGNKRSAAFAFVWFLQKSSFDFRTKITPETLTALALLIAESNPKEKDKMVGLVLLLLGK